MKEYYITIQVEVFASNVDEAGEIGRDLVTTLEQQEKWNLGAVEVSEIECTEIGR